MLLGKGHAGLKRVAVSSRSPQFSRLLTELLVGWKYTVTDNPHQADLLLVERGLPSPATDARVVWLTPLPLADESALLVPVSLTQLYLLLEEHFFPTPRRHIRISLEADLDLQINGRWLEGRLVSLSDRGARMTCPVELPKGTVLTVEVTLGVKTERMPVEVLYCIPAGDSVDRHPQVGVLFKPQDVRLFLMIQRFIEKSCVELACARAQIACNDPCVSWFEVAEDPWEKIG